MTAANLDSRAPLYLALIPGEYVGWGVCSTYLIRELAQLTPVYVISSARAASARKGIIPGKLVHTIGDQRLTRVLPLTGEENFGYTFFENILPDEARDNAKVFDRVLAGSSWCRDRLVEKGIDWADTLIQGIDPELFYPLEGEKPGAKDYFVIFSGGKFELRKGQDLVIRAVSVMQERHKDILFVNCWHNAWPFSLNSMVQSPWIRFRPQPKWDVAYLKQLLAENGIDLERTEILPLVSQDQLRRVYACTDIGLFPNRCEGGTNLVLMEYMACAKPVAASFFSGHTDILSPQNSLLLKDLTPFELENGGKDPAARWAEPSLDEIVDKLEYAYQHPDTIKALGVQAGKDLAQRTWKETAYDLMLKIGMTPLR